MRYPSPAIRLAAQLRRSRIALYSFLPLAALASASIMDTIQPALRLLYIMLGFSLIIFLHELGHFVVARLCSVKCLAFSIGIGPRMCGWRKNGGLTFGNDPYDPANKKTTDEGNVTVRGEKGPVEIHPDTPNLTADILGKPQKQLGVPIGSSTTPADRAASRADSVGDCDYRLSWLPLGGYVRMLGQDDMDPTKVSSDPNAFNQRPIWQRMCIVSAGVIMNVIFAAVCFSIIFSPGIGVDFPPARVGFVTYGMPAWGQLQRGDRIVSINGEKVRGFLEFTDVMMAAALSKPGESFRLEVIRYDTGQTEFKDIVPKHSDLSGFLAFGIEAMPGLKIGGKGEDYTNADAEKDNGNQVNFKENAAELNKLKEEGWKITAVDDVDLRDAPEPNATHDKYVLLYNHVNAKNGQPVTLSLVNTRTNATTTLKLLPHLEWIPGETKFPTVFGVAPQVLIADPMPKYPAAAAGLMAGDRILRIGDRSAPDVDQVRATIANSGGQPLDIDVERAAPVPVAPATAPASAPAAVAFAGTEVERLHVAPKKAKTGYVIGILPYQDLRSTRFVVPDVASEARDLGLDSGSTIAAIDGQSVKNWQEIYAQLRTKAPDSKVTVTFNAAGGPVSHAFAFTKAESDLVKDHLNFMLGLHLENETKTQVADNAGQAVLMAVDHTKKFILNVYMTLAGLFRRTVDPSNLHGIVGIAKVGYDVQERGTVWLWYVLAMVSVNLAVANFLPLPIVDGGLFLLLILEKIRGKPLSLKVQTVIQTVGIVLLAGLFLFVTINDIGLFTK